MKVIIKIILILSIFITSIYAKKSVYTYSKSSKDEINIFLVNNNLFDITYKYNATIKNLISATELPIINSLKAKSQTKIATFFIMDNRYKLSSHYSWVVGNKYAIHNNFYRYRLPYKINSSQVVTQGFNGSFSHKGNSQYAVDFGMKKGTKIYASRSGIVVDIKNDGNKHGKSKAFAKYANYITIKQDDGTYAKYVHLQKDGVKVHLGQNIKRGEFIGLSGNTGYTNGAHLHFVVFKAKDNKSRTSIPIKFISKNGIIIKPIRGKSYTSVK
jgi:murein DD-endopeptidase MepM/ murein hydrolase activator NlpD